MPTYEYICNDCETRFEHFQSMSSPALSNHPDCEKGGSNVERVISGGTGLIFKGSGFYLTDYKKNNEKVSDNKNSKKDSKPMEKQKNKNKSKIKSGEKTA